MYRSRLQAPNHCTAMRRPLICTRMHTHQALVQQHGGVERCSERRDVQPGPGVRPAVAREQVVQVEARQVALPRVHRVQADRVGRRHVDQVPGARPPLPLRHCNIRVQTSISVRRGTRTHPRSPGVKGGPFPSPRKQNRNPVFSWRVKQTRPGSGFCSVCRPPPENRMKPLGFLTEGLSRPSKVCMKRQFRPTRRG